MMTQSSETLASPSELLSMTFDELPLSAEVLEAISKMGFEQPTPVQAEAIPVALSGRDMIAMAQTGTGKTAAFGIPLAEKLDPKLDGVQALVLVPTRELALQVTKELAAIGRVRGIRPVAIYGGASFTNQVSEVGSGAQVVAGTPGRVLDHMRRGTIKFGGVHMLVLDEADEMLSMGFEKEISEIIEGLPKKRQTLLFSATIPADIQRLAQRYMGEATVVHVSGDDVGAKEIDHYVYLVSGQGRAKDLLRVLSAERPENAIVFCNTREETQTVARALNSAGYEADWLNSDLSQVERERVMAAMKAGKIKFLVATDVAARGIDISLLSHVINFTFPDSLQVYIHRTGRTGRMGRHGAAISLIAPQDIGNLYYLRLTYKIRTIEKKLPDQRQAQLAVEFDRFDVLRRAFAERKTDDYTALARRITQSIHSEAIIAGLLAEHFDAVVQGAQELPAGHWVDAESAPSRRSRERAASHRAEVGKDKGEEERGRGPRRGTSPHDKAVESDDVLSSASKVQTQQAVVEAEPEAELEVEPIQFLDAVGEESISEPGEPEREIYIDAGRKDGVRISQLMKELVDRTGLARTTVGKVRMMARATFIKVPQSAFETVLATLSRMEIDGRKLRAEPAKE